MTEPTAGKGNNSYRAIKYRAFDSAFPIVLSVLAEDECPVIFVIVPGRLSFLE
jgi:hypothetical protein